MAPGWNHIPSTSPKRDLPSEPATRDPQEQALPLELLARVAEMIVDAMHERQLIASNPTRPEPQSIIPLLQTSKSLCTILLPLLYKHATFITKSDTPRLSSFFSNPAASSYRYLRVLTIADMDSFGMNGMEEGMEDVVEEWERLGRRIEARIAERAGVVGFVSDGREGSEGSEKERKLDVVRSGGDYVGTMAIDTPQLKYNIVFRSTSAAGLLWKGGKPGSC